MKSQTCPNCHTVNDTGVYVTGQKLKCKGCGISLEVRHSDVVTRIGNRSLAQASGGRTFTAATSAEEKPTDPPRAPDSGAAAPVESAAPSLSMDNVVHLRRDGNTLPGPALDQTVISKNGLRIEVPGYQLVQLLGQGGMGEVWRAQQESLGRAVAVKVLPPQLATDPEFVARFAKESTALAALNHPNVIQIIDRGISGGHYYFVMELVSGRSLREVMNAGRLPAGEALKLIIQVVRAIDYAHEQGIIHRDLKPENILVDERGNVKVADFGLAGIQREQERQHQLTATAVAMGTVNYMAPEQRRDAKHVDGRADLYSVGVLFYEMLTAELPLGRFKLPSEKAEGVDPRFDNIVALLLEPEPEQRYQSAALLHADLEPLLADFTSATGRSPTTAKARPRNVAAERTVLRGHGAHPSVVASSWKGLRYGLTVVGALALVGFAVRMFGGTWQLDRNGFKAQAGPAKVELPLHLKHGHSGKGKLPPNTDGEMKAASKVVIGKNGVTRLSMDFEDGEEVIHAHAGSWTVADGKLLATQAGNETSGMGPLIPRAYIDDRFFEVDDLDLSVGMTINPLEPDDFPDLVNPQRFGELAFRFRDVQVSAFADADTGMRLAWKYTRPGGEEVGNSGRDVRVGLEDVVPVPSNRAFVVRLLLQRRDNGIQARAFVDDQQFASHFLLGLHGAVGKVALGCRNLHCVFDDLNVSGKLSTRPAGQSHEEH